MTLEMLDLKFNEIAKFYDVPMHIKAVNGIFLIDDFGRQQANRKIFSTVGSCLCIAAWTISECTRVRVLKLPFDELVIFSTNLHPSDLIDPAFQRRIAYKLETVHTPKTCSEKCFESEARKHSLDVTEAAYPQVLEGIRATRAPLAYSSPNSSLSKCCPLVSSTGTKPEFTPGRLKMPSSTSLSQKVKRRVISLK